jgi:hypothetical protein
MDKKYYNFLKGKSVALVGPAEYLTKIKLGSLIDSYDIVVRINRGMELIDRYPESLGKRTDIAYNCLIESLDNGGKIDIQEYKSRGVSWVSTVPGSLPTGECKSSRLHKMVSPKKVKKIKDNFNFHIMDHEKYGKLNKEVNCRSNTGFAAIFDLLNYKISELYICGFSFYLDSFISGYKDGCTRSDDIFAEQCFQSKRHNQKNQWERMKKLYGDEKRLKCDCVLDYILNMEELSRDDFKKANLYSD